MMMANRGGGDRRDKSRKAVKRSSPGESKGQTSPTKTSPKRQLSQREAKLPKASPTARKKPRATSPKKTPARATTRQPKKSVVVTKVKKKLNHDKKPVGVTKAKGKATTSTAKGKRQIRDSKGTSKKKVLGAKGAKKKGTTAVKTRVATTAKGRMKKRATVAKPKGATIAKGGKKKGKAVKETGSKMKKLPRHPNSKLIPNLKIQVVDKDPLFEVKTEKRIPKVSDYVDCKQAIRAVLTKDSDLLKKLINNTKEIPSLFVPRSVCLQDDALDYAVKTGNIDAIKLLYEERFCNTKSRKSMSQALMDHQRTGRYNYRTFGHAVRRINIGRKSREGNNAFTKDIEQYENIDEMLRWEKHMTFGLSPQVLNLLMRLFPGHEDESEFADNIDLAVMAGHHQLAGGLIKKFGGGYGFNKLHEEVLLAGKPEELSPFRAVSVRKKPYANGKITPLHCAAINPNPKILDKLLSIAPGPFVLDKVGFLPIHYAAACEGSGPLELLLKRGSKADELQPKTMVTPLMIAAKYGRVQNIETLIENIKSVAASLDENSVKMALEQKTNKGHFAIHYAAEGGHVDCVLSLVKHGASVEAMESALNNKITPLMIASERGYFRLAKVLIEKLGAEIEKKDKIKRTSLMLACINGHYPVATLLLRKGANPNAKDSSGNSPVHYAAAYGWWHCLKLLLKAGGDPNILTDWKVPPLGLAYLKGHLGCADLLLKEPGVDVNFRDDNGATLLLTTCDKPLSQSTVDLLKYLITKGADVHAVDINGKNALHFVAIGNQQSAQLRAQPNPLQLALKVVALKVVALLIGKGCDPAHKDNEGKTPISIALQNGHFEYVKAFLVNDAVVPLDADKTGDNPLHHIAKNCSQSRVSIIKLLAGMAKAVKLEEAVKMKDRQGCTPFLRCIVDNRGALADISDIDARVDGGSDTAPNDHAGSCALHFLAAQPPGRVWTKVIGMKPALDVLNADGKTPLIMAIDAKQTQNVHTLLSEGADPNSSDEFEHFSLLRAVCNDLPAVIPDLIAKGANIHGSLFKNKQPGIMHYIPAYIKNLDAKLRTAKELVAAGASLSAVDDENRTVLHNAFNAIESHVTTEFLEFLLDHKLDVFAVDNFGRLPVHYAIYKYNSFGENSPLRGGQFNNESHLDPIETVSLLASAMEGKKLNIQDKYGRTPMHYAAYRGAMISAMHIAGRINDIDVEDQDGHTPLSLAILNRQESMVIWLIQRGANINREVKLVGLESSANDQSVEPTQSSSSSPSSEEPQYWKWKALETPDAPDPQAQTSFFQAVVYEEWQGAVYVLMDCIANCGISYADAIRAVLAQQKFQLANEMIRKLRNPRNLLTTNDKGQNLLHLLAIHAEGGSHLQRQIAITLLHNGVKLFVTDYKGCTPLHYAAVNMNAVVCSAFAEEDPIGFKSCITCADNRGRVPVASLFWSLSYNSTKEIVELIRKHNGSLDVCTAFPNVSLLSMKQQLRLESLQDWYHNLPEEKTIDVTPLILMVLMNNFAGCQLLLKNGANPNATDRNGVTPLMHAVLQNEIAVVSVLMNKNYAEPLIPGIKRTSAAVQQVSPWISNIWKQKKSGSCSRQATFTIDEGYELEGSPEQCKFPKCKKTSSINLNAVDSQGRTAVHYLMKTCDYGTYENVEMLELLAGVGAKLSERDHQGKTPLDYSMETGSQKMAAALQKLIRVKPHKKVRPKPASPEWSDGIDFPSPKPNVDNDAKAMVEILEAERSKTIQDEDLKPTVDKHSDMADAGVVLMDEEQNIGYDIIMTIVEVQYGRYGLNNFYRMQLIHQLGKDMIVLFTRWGRIGDDGQFQKTPLPKEDAISEFKKIFKAKSGNDWENVKSFEKKPKKYMLVEIDPWRAKRNEAIKEFQFDLESSVPSELPKSVQNVMHEMTKPQALKMALGETGVDASIMNFSHMSREVLQKAIDILDKLGEVIKKSSESKGEEATYLASCEKMYELSNEYYCVIPHENFAHDVMRPIVRATEVEEHKNKLYSLLELEMVNRILLGATYRKHEINPLDYIYRALDCKVKLMDKDDEETQHILQYIHQSSARSPPNVVAIFRLSRDGEEERLKSCKLDNHKLLWHGSSVVNLLSILKKGLQINPVEAQRSGQRFGEGIYTSDAFAKSIAYCRRWEQNQPSHFMLLCEVALGKMAKGRISDEEKRHSNSTYAPGGTRTNGKREVCLPSGASLPLGMLHSNHMYCHLSDYSEYVAYTEEQVCLRYLVHVV
ncbi:poly [ADP-ribose] polymerase tankyrase-like isoform X2 [Patiria miniata]|uniref:Poly [ADP-ribose] polymerase n=1 Tax=Patiria miniata TaxID=46514 RepID=A0A914B9E0_PATMI|nr:poly [ADP-ribose] polymerase tankyrase-like isoform X2 [Patiria miniata]